LVDVFREVRRVLRDDGTLWLNIGDSYARAPSKGGSGPGGKNEDRWGYGAAQSAKTESSDGAVGRADRPGSRNFVDGLKPKGLIGIPWRVAFALQADGWYLRQDIIWAKPNPMPESVTDRCTKSHEYIFLLSKNERYYFDNEAIKEQSVRGFAGSDFNTGKTAEHQLGRSSNEERIDDGTRNKRDVWTVATKPYSEAHFATFPPALIEPCILSGCPEGGIGLDPFMGSGTTASVAIENGRKYIGTELNPEYITMAKKRILNTPPSLFQGVTP
jgi:site-specific DNA-methyltransferase (adenine-specific)